MPILNITTRYFSVTDLPSYFPKEATGPSIHGGMGNVPASLLPDNIQKYLDSIHASQMIGSVTRDKSRYDIVLHDGSLLSFNKKGELEAKE